MICTKCGAGLRESDQFCPKCGTRVIKEMRCPDCGAALREGTKFCHKCGSMVERSEGSGGAGVENMEDIPMDAIERNILSETARAHSHRSSPDWREGRSPRSFPSRVKCFCSAWS
ncbi:MAG: zinc-ribbon domain-containing protein, partial [Lachnospiraceae bacterium]|nr:zinc-ribbon domain-containing protein [Lachnospiraceae bacterium]